MTLLEASRISFRFGEHRAVDDVSLGVKPGRLAVLIGCLFLPHLGS